MNKQFTASEVRSQIAWLRNVTVVGTKMTYQMLDAYADLLGVQERAVPTVTRESAINAIEHVGRYNGPGRETEARQMLVEGSPSIAHHAQAQPPTASVADAIVRRMVAEYDAVLCGDPTATRTDGMRAALEAGVATLNRNAKINLG